MIDKSLYKTVRATRGYMAQQVADLSEEQLLQVPDGLRNNILWHVGHVVQSEAGIVYGRSGLDVPLPNHYTALYKGGTSPADWTETPDIPDVMEHLKTQTGTIYNEYKDGKFEGYGGFEMVPKYTLDTIEEAFAFNIFHESIHVGMVMTMRKLIGAAKG